MSNTDSTSDKIKGRVKEAAGALSGDDDLKNEGKNDQRAGKVKETVEDAADSVKDGIDSVKDRFSK